MTVKEAQSVIKQFRDAGLDDTSIQYAFCRMFLDDKLDVNQLNALLSLMDTHLSDEFLKMSTREQKEYMKKQFKLK